MTAKRVFMFSVVALLVACKKPPETSLVDQTPAGPPPPILCPEGATLTGYQPPSGTEMWCQIPDLAHPGLFLRQGPAIMWHVGGNRQSLGQYESSKKNGYWQTWYSDGQPESQGTWQRGTKIGLWTEFHSEGGKKSEGEYEDGNPIGQWTYWYPNGQLQTEGKMVTAGREGMWIEYDETGRPISERTYRGGKLMTHRQL